METSESGALEAGWNGLARSVDEAILNSTGSSSLSRHLHVVVRSVVIPIHHGKPRRPHGFEYEKRR